MIVECESCGSTFRLDETLLQAGGAKVRCSVCKAVFTVDPYEDSPISLEEETKTAKKQEADRVETPAPGLMDSTSEEINGDGRLDTDLDTAYRDAFRESPKDWARKEAGDLVEDRTEDADEVPLEFPDKEEEPFDDPMEKADILPVKKKKSGVSKIITVALVIFLLFLAAAVALVFLRPQWIPPYLSFLKPPVKKQVSDAGVRLLMFKGVSGSFLDTEKAGNLFLIRGEVSSRYRKPRSYILIKGNILDEKGQVIKSELSYAGNTFTDEELKTISYEKIKRAMKNKDGMARQNFNVPPGETIPFMIVFRNLPDNLSEFTVEAVSSSPGT